MIADALNGPETSIDVDVRYPNLMHNQQLQLAMLGIYNGSA